MRAQEKYLSKVEDSHTYLQRQPSGIILITKLPFMGASPDGLISCDYKTEKGCLEIKCPYKHATSLSILEACEDNDFCHEIDAESQEPTLKTVAQVLFTSTVPAACHRKGLL